MKMKDKKIGLLGLTISLVGFVVYSICVFLLASNYTSTFWISYIFTAIAFFAQIIAGLTFSKTDADSKFLQLPLFYIGSCYLLIQLVVGIVFMLIHISATLPLILQVMILAVYLSLMLTSLIGKEQITKTEANIKATTFNIRMLTIDAEHLYTSEVNEDKKAELKKLYEAIRYSDPVSTTDKVRSLDVQIDAAFKKIETLVTSCSLEDLNSEIKIVLDLIAKRSLLCKSSK